MGGEVGASVKREEGVRGGKGGRRGGREGEREGGGEAGRQGGGKHTYTYRTKLTVSALDIASGIPLMMTGLRDSTIQ